VYQKGYVSDRGLIVVRHKNAVACASIEIEHDVYSLQLLVRSSFDFDLPFAYARDGKPRGATSVQSLVSAIQKAGPRLKNPVQFVAVE
jgi:hypothetical protein